AAPSVELVFVKSQDAPEHGDATTEVPSLAVNPAVCVPRHQPLLPAGVQESAGEWRVTPGAVESIWNGPALIPTLQLPAASQAEPDEIVTDDPSIDVLCVNLQDEPEHGETSPDVPSLAVNPAVCVPRHQPLLPASEQPFAAASSETDGACVSSFTSAVAGPPVLPAASKAEQLIC